MARTYDIMKTYDSMRENGELPETVKESDDERINHPAHYTRFPGAEVIDITEHMDFCLGNVVKYVCRAGYKPGVPKLEDLRKAQWYLQREIDRIESGG